MARALPHAAVLLALLAGILALAAGGGRAAGWAVASTAVLAAAAALLLSLGARSSRSPRPLLLGLTAALAAWAALGSVPLPAGLITAISPRRAEVQRAVPRGEHGIGSWPAAVTPEGRSLAETLGGDPAPPSDLAPVLGPPVPAPVSFAPWATRIASAVLLAFLVLLVAIAGRSDERAGLAIACGCSALAVVAAVSGLWLSRAAPRLLHGRLEPPESTGTFPYGSFWSPNHAAALFALALPILAGCAVDAAWPRLLRALGAGAALVVGLALVDAGSRGGLLAGGLGAAVLGVALMRRKDRRLLGGALLIAAAAGVVLSFTVLAERVLDESFEETTSLRGSNAERHELYELEARMVRAVPLAGCGLGAFRTAQAVFRTEPSSLVPLHGESDWLEIAVEGGVPFLLLFAALAAAVLAPAVRLVARGEAPPLLGGLVAATIAVLAHAAVDFHLREPLVALAAIASAGAAHAWAMRLRREQEPGARAGSAWPAAQGAVAAIALLLAGFVAVREIPRDRAATSALRLLLGGDADAAAIAARRAAEASPGHGDAWALLGWAEESRAHATKPGRERTERRRAAIEASVAAIELSPAAFGAARRCASILLQAGAESEAAAAAGLAMAVSSGQGQTRRVAGQLLLRRGPSREALEHLAHAYRSLPLARIDREARALTAWMLEAAGGDPLPALDLVGSPGQVAWYVTELHRLGKEAEARACLVALAEHPPSEGADALSGLIVLLPGDESAMLARSLKPLVQSPLARQRVGIALVRAGDAPAGLELIRQSLAAGADTPEAWLAAADAEASLGNAGASLQALRDGLGRHPESAALSRRLKQAEVP